MGWGLGDLSGDLLGYDKPPDVQGGSASVMGQINDIIALMFTVPELGKGFQMAQALGQNPWSYIKQFVVPGDQGTSDMPIVANLGKLDVGALAAANASMADAYENKQIDFFNNFYDKMGKVPALAGIFSEAQGNVDSTGALAKIFGDMSGAALGSAASSGFLTDPVKQGNVLGPLALQKYQIEQSIQKNAQAQVLGLTGAGNIIGGSKMAMLGPGVSPFTQIGMQGAGLFGGLNAQLGFNASAQNAANFNSYQQAGLNAQMQGFSMMFGGMGG